MEIAPLKKSFKLTTRSFSKREKIFLAVAVPLTCLFIFACNDSYRRVIAQARVARVQSDLSELAEAIDQFRQDCKRYPTMQEGIQALTNRPKGLSTWHGPYLRYLVSIDPWGNHYVYKSPGPRGGGYEVVSYGADGKPGGEWEDADVTNGSDD